MKVIHLHPVHLECFSFSHVGTVFVDRQLGPRPIWYGTIDGLVCTAACGSPLSAENEARHSLLFGAYPRRLTARANDDDDRDGDSNFGLTPANARQRLDKLGAWFESLQVSHGR